MMGEDGWGETSLSDQKLENPNPISVGLGRYDPHGSGRVGQGLVWVGHGEWGMLIFFFNFAKK
jgi:hypothetical protein